MSFQAFNADKLSYSPGWKTMPIDEKKNRYQKYLKAFYAAQRSGTDKNPSIEKELYDDLAELKPQEAKYALEPLDVLECAKIATEVIKDFNIDEMMNLLEMFESNRDAFEAARLSHSKLEPQYVSAVQHWYVSNKGFSHNGVTPFRAKESVEKCMEFGMNAVAKKLGLEAGDANKSGDNTKLEEAPPSQRVISKTRSWKEMKNESKSG